jgi:hypothetical protein
MRRKKISPVLLSFSRNITVHITMQLIPPMSWMKGKAIPVTGRGGPYGCETSRLPHFLDNRLTDGGEVVSLTRRSPFIPRKIPGTHFC